LNFDFWSAFLLIKWNLINFIKWIESFLRIGSVVFYSSERILRRIRIGLFMSLSIELA
jgi:hypothetical protein